jgi:hypothetical protein
MMHRVAESIDGTLGSLLPETVDLLSRLERAGTNDDISRMAVPPNPRLASYTARPEVNVPFMRFHLAEADGNLLCFAGLPAPGFEVLQVQRAGLQFHWRSDLVRAFDEGRPILGRFHALSPSHEFIVEHLAVPIHTRHRIREVRGWFVFSQDVTSETCDVEQVGMFRRPVRSQVVPLPAQLTEPDRKASGLQGVLGSVRARWSERRRGMSVKRARHTEADPNNREQVSSIGSAKSGWPSPSD